MVRKEYFPTTLNGSVTFFFLVMLLNFKKSHKTRNILIESYVIILLLFHFFAVYDARVIRKK